MRRSCVLLVVVLCALAVAALPAGAVAQTPGFAVQWPSVPKRDAAAVRSLRASGLVETLAARLNARYALPQAMAFRVGHGAQGVPYIERPPAQSAYVGVMASQWLTWERSHLGPAQALWKKLPALRKLGVSRVTNLSSAAFLAHEAGHGLITMLDLPFTGREEDAADGFAAYFMLSDPAFGPDAVIALAGAIAPLIATTPLKWSSSFADDHSLPQQRIIQLLCWVYGSDPNRFASLRANSLLPFPRSRRCEGEWRQLQSSWSRLLGAVAVG